MDNSNEFQLMLDEAIRSEPLAFKGFDRSKNVQDQLQEMVGGNPVALESAFHIFLDKYPTHLTPETESMEQLWLAFVMKENHNKIWDENKWEVK